MLSYMKLAICNVDLINTSAFKNESCMLLCKKKIVRFYRLIIIVIMSRLPQYTTQQITTEDGYANSPAVF